MATTAVSRAASNLAYDLTAADAVWVATAMLHREHPKAEGFEKSEIIHMVERLKLTSAAQTTISQHVAQHCVADLQPNPGRTRMLPRTPRGLRRLYKPSDPTHPRREDAPYHPDWSMLPPKYHALEAWYSEWSGESEDALLALVGSGRETWAGVDAVDYINRMREGLE